jgi:hypothetical protein
MGNSINLTQLFTRNRKSLGNQTKSTSLSKGARHAKHLHEQQIIHGTDLYTVLVNLELNKKDGDGN